MACWSAENATKAYLRALKMGKRGKEPDVAEFISALAAGNNAQLMVMSSSSSSGSVEKTSSMALALIVAAAQTKGRVVIILDSFQELQIYENSLGPHARFAEFLVGDFSTLLQNKLKSADLVLIDCKSGDQAQAFKAAISSNSSGTLVVGYNAMYEGGKWSKSRLLNAQFLPIGEGLLVNRTVENGGRCRKINKSSNWIVRVDEVTGEEHVFRVGSPRTRESSIIKA